MELTNADILTAQPSLNKLMEQKFPVKTSMALVKLNTALSIPFKEINTVRDGLIKKHGEDLGQGNIGLTAPNNPENKPQSPGWNAFVLEFNELMMDKVNVEFTHVKLPEYVAATCDKCGHNMDRLLEIEPIILASLEKFIEV